MFSACGCPRFLESYDIYIDEGAAEAHLSGEPPG
jgi:hypothetical protein